MGGGFAPSCRLFFPSATFSHFLGGVLNLVAVLEPEGGTLSGRGYYIWGRCIIWEGGLPDFHFAVALAFRCRRKRLWRRRRHGWRQRKKQSAQAPHGSKEFSWVGSGFLLRSDPPGGGSALEFFWVLFLVIFWGGAPPTPPPPWVVPGRPPGSLKEFWVGYASLRVLASGGDSIWANGVFGTVRKEVSPVVPNSRSKLCTRNVT